MFQHVLIAMDGSLEAKKAFGHGLTLAKALSAKVTVATLTELWAAAAYATLPTPSRVQIYEKAAAANAAAILDRTKNAANQAEVRCVTRHIKDGHAPEGIIEAAREAPCDLIIGGSHGRGVVGQILLSSASNGETPGYRAR